MFLTGILEPDTCCGRHFAFRNNNIQGRKWKRDHLTAPEREGSKTQLLSPPSSLQTSFDVWSPPDASVLVDAMVAVSPAP